MPPNFDVVNTPIEIGRTLIEASAGTGKTYTLVGIIARLVIENKLSLEQIAVCTFTEAATAEMRKRVRQMLLEAINWCNACGAHSLDYLPTLIKRSTESPLELRARLETALRDVDLATISTLHGFCQRLLQDRALETGNRLESEVLTDHTDLLFEVAADFWRSLAYQEDSLQVRLFLHYFPIPKPLAALTNTFLRYPEVRIVRHFGTGNHEELCGQWANLWNEISRQWNNDGEKITQLLFSDLSWGNLPFSRPDRIQLIIDSIDNHVAKGTDFSAALDGLIQLSQSNLLACQKKRQKNPVPTHPFFVLCDDLVNFLPQWQEATSLFALQTIQKELLRRKKSQGLIGFSDMITEVQSVIKKLSPDALLRLRGSWRVVMIDEFQDTDPAQTLIFNTLFDPASNWMFFIGDPKQSIYSFRGADLFTYLEFKKTTQRHYSLATNYRSSPNFISACNTFFEVNPDLFQLDDIRYTKVSPKETDPVTELVDTDSNARPLTLWLSEDKTDELLISRWVATEISRLLAEQIYIGTNKVGSKDIAVLTATHKQSAIVQNTLAKNGIPSVIKNGTSVFKSKEALAIHQLLQAIAQPRRGSLLKTALSTTIFNLGGNALHELAGNDALWAGWQNQFHEWNEHFRSQGVMSALNNIFHKSHTILEMVRHTGGERSVTNLLHLAELLHCADVASPRDPNSLAIWLGKKIITKSSNQEASEQRLDIDQHAVQILTVHAAKGLEFPIVFAPYFLKLKSTRQFDPPYFHHSDGTLTAHIHPSENTPRDQALEELHQEQIRLLYVALTRARQRCYLVVPAMENRPKSPIDMALKLGTAARDELEGLLASNENIAISEPSLSAHPSSFDNTGVSQLKRRYFTGSISRDWRITSFTALSRLDTFDLPDYDFSSMVSPAKDSPTGLDLFPAGAALGTCLHKILEKVDFQDSSQWKKIIQQQLYLTFPNKTSGDEYIFLLLQKLVATPLMNGITLADLTASQTIVELEFQFPISHLTLARLRKTCERFPIPIDWDTLKFESVRGMLKGFIDLVWRHGNRYFILDWKSNQLPSYDHQGMLVGMRHSHYGLQYLLYCVALRRWLTQRVVNFSWEEHFGGVTYVFLRGITDSSANTGIYRDRPSLELLDAMEAMLTS